MEVTNTPSIDEPSTGTTNDENTNSTNLNLPSLPLPSKPLLKPPTTLNTSSLTVVGSQLHPIQPTDKFNVEICASPLEGEKEPITEPSVSSAVDEFHVVFYTKKKGEERPENESLLDMKNVRLPMRLKKRLDLLDKSLKISVHTNPVYIVEKEFKVGMNRKRKIQEVQQKLEKKHKLVFQRVRRNERVREKRYEMKEDAGNGNNNGSIPDGDILDNDFVPKLPTRLKLRLERYSRPTNSIIALNWRNVEKNRAKVLDRTRAKLKIQKDKGNLVRTIGKMYKKNLIITSSEHDNQMSVIHLPKRLRLKAKQAEQKFEQKLQALKKREADVFMRKHEIMERKSARLKKEFDLVKARMEAKRVQREEAAA